MKKEMKKRTNRNILGAGAILLILGIIIFVILQIIPEKNDPTIKVYCSQESRNAEACIEVYDPVCGFDSEGNELKTFGNSCFACINGMVDYYIKRECQ